MEKKTKLFVTINYLVWNSWFGWFSASKEYEVNSEEEGYKMAFQNERCYSYSIKEIPADSGQKVKTSKTVIFGKVYTLRQIKHMKKTKMVEDMKANREKNAVKTRVFGQWIPWSADAEYISDFN